MQDMSQTITVRQNGQPIYNILLRDSFDEIGEAIAFLSPEKKRICIVTDSNVAEFHLSQMEKLLTPICSRLISFIFPAGEAQKNLDTVRRLYTALIEAGFDRGDLLVALGGGVVGDLTGFAAATYLRGISFIQVPTTLLSQVDSSIGGKTGVDFDSYKNMVGAFKQPSLVYMNLSSLNTLPEREYLSGMGEIVKHGMIKDADYYHWLRQNTDKILNRDYDILEEMIAVSCRIKKDVVEKDPTEQGERALLNFGHTLGHAVEKLCGFSLLHGECVAAGCMAALYLSGIKGNIASQELNNCRALLELLKLPVTFPADLDPEDVIQATKHDKKMFAGVIRFILLNRIGSAYIDNSVTDEDMRNALQYMGLENK